VDPDPGWADLCRRRRPIGLLEGSLKVPFPAAYPENGHRQLEAVRAALAFVLRGFATSIPMRPTLPLALVWRITG